MNDLIRVRQYVDGEYPFNMVLEWRLKLKGQEYGEGLMLDASLPENSGIVQDSIVEAFVRQMDDSVQKILHGETRTEKHMREIKSVYERFASAYLQG